jgi:hypothetical protein
MEAAAAATMNSLSAIIKAMCCQYYYSPDVTTVFG